MKRLVQSRTIKARQSTPRVHKGKQAKKRKEWRGQKTEKQPARLLLSN